MVPYASLRPPLTSTLDLSCCMKQIALLMISAYKTFVSPHKGFSCAYRICTGKASCSTFGYKAIERGGITTGILLLRRRFKKCSAAHSRSMTNQTQRHFVNSAMRYQSGHCDLPVGDCDIGHHCDASDICSIVDCGSPCDFDFKRRKKQDDGGYIVVKPRS